MIRFILILLTISALNTGAICQSTHKNGVSLELGYGGGDNRYPTGLFGIEYKRSLLGWLDGYLKYNAQMDSQNERMDQIEDKFLNEENTSDFTHREFSQFYSYGVGLNIKLVKTLKSTLYLELGARYFASKYSDSGTGIENTDPLIINLWRDEVKEVGYEVGIGYSRLFKDRFFVGGEINHIAVRTRISGSLILGTYF